MLPLLHRCSDAAVCLIVQLGRTFSGPKHMDENYVKGQHILQTIGFAVRLFGGAAPLSPCPGSLVTSAHASWRHLQPPFRGGIVRSSAKSQTMRLLMTRLLTAAAISEEAEEGTAHRQHHHAMEQRVRHINPCVAMRSVSSLYCLFTLSPRRLH